MGRSRRVRVLGLSGERRKGKNVGRGGWIELELEPPFGGGRRIRGRGAVDDFDIVWLISSGGVVWLWCRLVDALWLVEPGYVLVVENRCGLFLVVENWKYSASGMLVAFIVY